MSKIVIPPLELQSVTGYAAPADDPGPFATAALGDLGGLTQFGVRIEMLPPGSSSSMRHWHSSEDEFVQVLEGALTLVEDTGERSFGPGDAAAFPAGRRNGHCLQNRSQKDARFLVAGWRDPEDICTYSGRDRLCVKTGAAARFTRRDGTPIAPEEEPAAFEDPAPEGRGGAIDPFAVEDRAGSGYPEPYATAMLHRSWKPLGRAGGLGQFGVNLVTLQPGCFSSLRHWHSAEDECVLILEGGLTLIENDGETALQLGDATAHPAGVPNGHCMRNDTPHPARFLVIGTRAAKDICTYSDVDLINFTDGPRSRYTRRDGTHVKEE